MTTDTDMAQRVWAALSTDTDLDLAFGWLPNTDRVAVRQLALDLWMKFNDKKLHLQETFNRISAAATDRADFERLAESHPDREILLAMGLGAEIDWQVWKLVRPE